MSAAGIAAAQIEQSSEYWRQYWLVKFSNYNFYSYPYAEGQRLAPVEGRHAYIRMYVHPTYFVCVNGIDSEMDFVVTVNFNISSPNK